jgi:hypothetical protein
VEPSGAVIILCGLRKRAWRDRGRGLGTKGIAAVALVLGVAGFVPFAPVERRIIDGQRLIIFRDEARTVAAYDGSAALAEPHDGGNGDENGKGDELFFLLHHADRK